MSWLLKAARVKHPKKCRKKSDWGIHCHEVNLPSIELTEQKSVIACDWQTGAFNRWNRQCHRKRVLHWADKLSRRHSSGLFYRTGVDGYPSASWDLVRSRPEFLLVLATAPNGIYWERKCDASRSHATPQTFSNWRRLTKIDESTSENVSKGFVAYQSGRSAHLHYLTDPGSLFIISLLYLHHNSCSSHILELRWAGRNKQTIKKNASLVSENKIWKVLK
jgi:hypothetical protein